MDPISIVAEITAGIQLLKTLSDAYESMKQSGSQQTTEEQTAAIRTAHADLAAKHAQFRKDAGLPPDDVV